MSGTALVTPRLFLFASAPPAAVPSCGRHAETTRTISARTLTSWPTGEIGQHVSRTDDPDHRAVAHRLGRHGEHMHVVVTGGAGFIGANLVRAFTAMPAIGRITVIDDLSTGDRANLAGLNVDFVRGSVTDAALLDGVLAGVDAVVHLAALPSVPRSLRDPLATHVANATGTLQVLEAVRRAGRPYLVVASSSSVYGANSNLPKHEGMRCAPVSPYAVSKLAAESYAIAYAHCFDLAVLPVRFFNVFGPLQPAGHAYAAVVPTFIAAALAGRPLVVYGDGKQTRDFTYVGSVCAVLADAVQRKVTSVEPVNLAFGRRRSLLDLIAELEGVMDTRLAVEHREPRPGDVRDSQADCARLLALFPDAHPFELRAGLESTVAWSRRRFAR